MSRVLGQPSRRAAHLAADNPLRALTEVISRVPDGINLGQGVCDLEMPAALATAAVDSIRGADRQTYTHYSGLPELKTAIRAKLARDNGLAVGEDEVMVASGSSGAMYAAALALLDPGEEVVLFEPFYSYHRTTFELLELVPVPVALGDDLSLDVDALSAAVSERTGAVVVNTPANPSGKVFTVDELESVARVLAGTDAYVFTDEVYEYLCYDGRRHVSPATVDGLDARTLTIGSLSKTFSITGWRIGYLAGPRAAVELAGRVFDQIAVCAARPLQRGAAHALAELDASFYERLRQGYERKRDRFCAALRQAGFDVSPPQGAYYVLAGYTGVLGDVEPYHAALQLIERAGINGVPGDVFYARPDGVRSIRFHFAVDDGVLDAVCRRLASL